MYDRTHLVHLVLAVLLISACGDDVAEMNRDGGVDGATDGGMRDATTDTGSNPDGGPPSSALTCAPLNCGPSNGPVITVAAGMDLQGAIDAAPRGATLELEPGATFTGPIRLPEKPGEECITIRTATPDSELIEGRRVSPADVGRLASVVAPGGGQPALTTAPRAAYCRLVGLELYATTPTPEVFAVVQLGQGESSADDLPHHIFLERSWVHGQPDANYKVGVVLNSASTCIIDSTISDFHSDAQDSQAIGGINGPGPFRIINNRLEGSAENILFGGGVPAIAGLVPSDIVVRGNHFTKPLSWRAGDPANTGYTPWVKNLFELKNARDVTVDGNYFENNWVGADQHGYAIVLTPRTEGGAAPWAVVEDVRITNNVIRQVGGGVSILGMDSGGSAQTNSILIRNNAFLEIRTDYSSGDPVRVLQFNGVAELTVDHNVFHYLEAGHQFARAYGVDTTDFTYTNNVVFFGGGLWSDCGRNTDAIMCRLPAASVESNVFIGGPDETFGGQNFYPESAVTAGVPGWGGSQVTDYALDPASPYANRASDGTNPGVDLDALNVALAARE